MGAKNKLGTTKRVSPKEYDAYFKDREKEVLNRALEIRRFEIDLYWKRAAYFWAFIGATFAGFLAIQASEAVNKQDLSVILSCLGIVFSFAWFCVNRGSKFWQENWEKHVDVLEDKVDGPLYKIVLSRNVDDYKWTDKVRDMITGPSALSVSKINQLISLYVFILWIILLLYSLPDFSRSASINKFYLGLVLLTALVCISFIAGLGKTYRGGYWHNAELRKSRIKPTEEEAKKIIDQEKN